MATKYLGTSSQSRLQSSTFTPKHWIFLGFIVDSLPFSIWVLCLSVMIAKKIAKLNQNSICFLHACKVLWKVLKSGVVEMQCTFKLPLTGSLACCLLVNFCENDLEFPLQMEFIQIIMLYSFFPLLCYPIYYTYFEILE